MTLDLAPVSGPAPGAPAGPSVRIDFLFLDLDTCTRCRGTDLSLDAALDAVTDVLAAADVDVEVNRVHVDSEATAEAFGFVSSPTIRVNGHDIALELRENSCAAEACTDGCGGHIACRVWAYRGREYTEPPPPMIVEAILRHQYGAVTEPVPAAPYVMPDNLRRFFAGKAESRSHQKEATPAAAECCPRSTQATCCAATTKDTCCADPSTTCGCQ